MFGGMESVPMASKTETKTTTIGFQTKTEPPLQMTEFSEISWTTTASDALSRREWADSTTYTVHTGCTV